MNDESPEAYALCAGLHGTCRCAERRRPACQAILDLSENGETLEDELARIAKGCADTDLF